MQSHDSFLPRAQPIGAVSLLRRLRIKHLLLIILATVVATPRAHAQYGASNQDTVYSLPGGLIMDAVIGDFTSDGRLDIVTLDTIHGVRVLEFDGIRWVPVPSNNPPYNKGQALGKADFNGDGKLDLFVGRIGPNAVFHGDGSGNFIDATPPEFATHQDATVDVEILESPLTEMPCSSYTTALCSNDGTPSRAYAYNRSSGKYHRYDFRGSYRSSCMRGSYQPKLQRWCIVRGSRGNPMECYYYEPCKGLTEAPGGVLTDVTSQLLPPSTDITTDIAWVGTGANGLPDLVIANNGAPNRHLVYDGTRFNEISPPLGAPTGPTLAIVAGDWDQDGLDDIATFDIAQRPAFFFNNGTTFDPRTLIASKVNGPREALSRDLDGDGDTDIVIVDSDKVTVLKSRINELSISATTKVGKTASFTVYAERSSEVQNAYVFASLGLSPNPVYLPFGRVDVASDAVLALLVSVARFSSRGTGTLDVPMDPNIVGLEVLFQAALATVTFGNIRITNVDGTELVPGG